jgi:hypothetical protein
VTLPTAQTGDLEQIMRDAEFQAEHQLPLPIGEIDVAQDLGN